jgi:aminoglycoside/choline kinase family phosphotransferase
LFDVLAGADGAARMSWYERARALCDRFGAATADLTVAARFDRAHIAAELAEFQAMGLEARLAMTLGPAARALLGDVFADLSERLLALPYRLAHRDFQSQNLMVTARGLVVVDFQDAFMAPFVYDLVALLRDSYVRLDASELAALLAPYPAATREAFGVQTIQRKLKDAGRFVTLAHKGKPEYLPFFGDTIGYVVEALVATGLYPDLLALLVELLPEAREAALRP